MKISAGLSRSRRGDESFEIVQYLRRQFGTDFHHLPTKFDRRQISKRINEDYDILSTFIEELNKLIQDANPSTPVTIRSKDDVEESIAFVKTQCEKYDQEARETCQGILWFTLLAFTSILFWTISFVLAPPTLVSRLVELYALAPLAVILWVRCYSLTRGRKRVSGKDAQSRATLQGALTQCGLHPVYCCILPIMLITANLYLGY